MPDGAGAAAGSVARGGAGALRGAARCWDTGTDVRPRLLLALNSGWAAAAAAAAAGAAGVHAALATVSAGAAAERPAALPRHQVRAERAPIQWLQVRGEMHKAPVSLSLLMMGPHHVYICINLELTCCTAKPRRSQPHCTLAACTLDRRLQCMQQWEWASGAHLLAAWRHVGSWKG